MSVLSHPERLGERYEVLSVLGSGGMADVYLARDTELDREVAVKVLRDTGGTARFRAEARTLARLRHPSLVAVLDVGEADDRPYIVLEHVEGSTLADRCRTGALQPNDVAALGQQVAAALAYVHEQGVVHRDVSPGNVLVSADGRAHLADFGIARILVDHPTLTAAGETLGTAPYLAPEQARGEQATAAVDVYALGLTLLEAVTGERCFEGTASEAAMARLHRDPEVPASLPAEWRELLTGMTRRDPAERPSAAAVQVRLARLAGATEGTRVLTVPVPAPPPARQTQWVDEAVARVRDLAPLVRQVPRTAWVALAVLALVILVAVAAGGGAEDRRQPLPRGVPSSVTDELQQLHDAVDGR